MKYFLAILFLSLGVQAQTKYFNAAKKSLKKATGSKISELHYFPSQWEFDVTLGYRYSKFQTTAKANGTTVVDYDRGVSTAISELKLGLLDSLYLQLDWDYLVTADVSYTKPVNTPSEKSTGPKDPKMAAVFRAVDASSFKLDTKVSFQPTLGNHNEPDAQNNGDALSGGHEFGVGARAVALITDSSQLAFSAEYLIGSDTTSVDQASNVESVQSAHNLLQMQILVQTEIATDLFFGAGVEIVSEDGYDNEDQQTRQKIAYGSTSAKSLAFLLGYELTADDAFRAEFDYLIDYTSDVNGYDLSTEGMSGAVAYTHRF